MPDSEAASTYRIYRNILLVLFRGGVLLLVGADFVAAMALAATHLVPGARAERITAIAVMTAIGLTPAWLGVRARAAASLA